MNDLLNIVATLEQIPDQVSDAIAGVSESVLSHKPSPDEWCVKEIMAHMFETDVAFAERVRTILATDDVPALPRAKPPWKLHEGKGYELYSPEQLIAQMRQFRAESLAIVRRLSPQDWVQQGTLMGSVSSILDLGTWVANHDKGHLAQIRRLCGKSE